MNGILPLYQCRFLWRDHSVLVAVETQRRNIAVCLNFAEASCLPGCLD